MIAFRTKLFLFWNFKIIRQWRKLRRVTPFETLTVNNVETKLKFNNFHLTIDTILNVNHKDLQEKF
jgi:hypothetical protein